MSEPCVFGYISIFTVDPSKETNIRSDLQVGKFGGVEVMLELQFGENPVTDQCSL